ncbi:FHY3/FAR1 family [Vigna unguiculata]|uniref:FHY3/FAR1 family n=1 Tax=Vigna unguiculata TaxID=3917 RepID=A0A4D6NEL8_VIGUN|nr:FHY3/FAR1 family [Vigna unguiculata]
MTRVTRENSKREYTKPLFILPPYTYNTTHKILPITPISSISYLTAYSRQNVTRKVFLVGERKQGDKDKKISELTMELERQDQLCASYREKLLSFINNVEEETHELSTKVQLVVENRTGKDY